MQLCARLAWRTPFSVFCWLQFGMYVWSRAVVVMSSPRAIMVSVCHALLRIQP